MVFQYGALKGKAFYVKHGAPLHNTRWLEEDGKIVAIWEYNDVLFARHVTELKAVPKARACAGVYLYRWRPRFTKMSVEI